MTVPFPATDRDLGEVDWQNVTRDGQGKEGLAEGIDPEPWILQAAGIQGHDIAKPPGCPGQGKHIDPKAREQEKEDRHHDPVGLFDAACHAEDHDQAG